jgi:hypothetical protein
VSLDRLERFLLIALTSDHDGEIVGAMRQARRVLEGAKVDVHKFASNCTGEAAVLRGDRPEPEIRVDEIFPGVRREAPRPRPRGGNHTFTVDENGFRPAGGSSSYANLDEALEGEFHALVSRLVDCGRLNPWQRAQIEPLLDIPLRAVSAKASKLVHTLYADFFGRSHGR